MIILLPFHNYYLTKDNNKKYVFKFKKYVKSK